MTKIRRNKLIYLSVILFTCLFSCKKEGGVVTQTPETILLDSGQIQACSSDEYLKFQLAADPEMKVHMDAIEKNILLNMANKGSFRSTTSVVTVPVVVHVVFNTTAQNISDAQIQSQIDVLNEDFGRKNADTINIPAYFRPYAANVKIQFVLAKRDPNGNATNGITRTYTSVTAFSTNGYVSYDAYGGINPWNTSQYLNIWVCNLNGPAGYSAMPGASSATDGVVIHYTCFGRTGTLMSTRNKGRTATHEIGHWFGLAHIWGPSGTCGDDGVTDTPIQEKSNSGVPLFPHVSACSPNAYGDMFMSYMDYTDDAGRDMFSIGQSDRINATLYGYRTGLLTSLGGVDPGSTTTTTEVCNAPTGLFANLVTPSSATLNWSSSGAATYNIRYRSTASSTWITTTSSLTSVVLSGLSSSTTYEFQIAGICSGTLSSSFSPSATFTTPAPLIVCNVPTGLFANSITTRNVVLNWASSGAQSYTVRYKSINSSTWITVTTTALSVSVSGLSTATTYEFQVSGKCSASLSSSFSSSALFTTSGRRK